MHPLTCTLMHSLSATMVSGIAGGAGPNRSDANIGTTIGEIYDPKQPIGQRWTTVADSQIWRLYHSVAFLTSNAEVEGHAHCA